MAVRLLIADAYRTYRDRLAEALNKKRPGEFDITAFSSQTDLAAALKDLRYDVLLLDPSVYTRNINLQNARLTILLVDEEEKINIHSDLASFDTVHKYQRITDIMNAVLNRLADLPGARAQLQVVFSPSGGTGTTTLSVAMAFQYAKLGKRILYVNWEEFNSSSLFFDDNEYGLSAVFTELRQGTGRHMNLDALIKEDTRSHVMYLPAFDHLNDLSLISPEEARLFFNVLMDSNRFDVIVVDAPHSVDEKLLAVFAMADFIILIAELSETGQLKMDQLLDQTSIFAHNKSKTRLIYNKKPARWNTPKGDIPIMGEVPPQNPAAYRELIENIQQAGFITML